MGASNALVATLLTMAGQRNVLTIPRAFVHFTKSLEAAMLLNQLLYWIPRGHDEGSIYKSDKEWQEELCLSRYAVRQARECLEAMGFLTTERHRVKGAPTLHYFLDYDALVDRWTEWLKTEGRLSEIEQSDYPKTNNRMSENEQSDRAKSDNEIVRNRTNIKEHEIPTKTPPPPATKTTADTSQGGGGGFDPEVARLFASYGIYEAEPLARFYRDAFPQVTLAELRDLCARLYEPDAGKHAPSRLLRLLRTGPTTAPPKTATSGLSLETYQPPPRLIALDPERARRIFGKEVRDAS